MILTAFYDLDFGPVSFDFVTWLVRAMKTRDSLKCDGLHAVVVPKEDGVGGFSRDWAGYDEAAARWRLWHIVVASCPLARATVTLAASRKQALQIADQAERAWWPEGKAHFMGPLVDAARKGEAIPKLQATVGARRYVDDWLGKQKVITLTVRHQAADPTRNSNIAAWEQLRDRVERRGYVPVWLDDTNVALSKGRGFAELDPDLRLALYERAALNFVGNNGPQELLKFSGAPYRIFGLGLESWRDHFRRYFHMEYGDQLPWAGPQQVMVYKLDQADHLIHEFEAWESATK